MALASASVSGNNCVAVITKAAQAFVEERTLSGIRAAKQGFENEAQFFTAFKMAWRTSALGIRGLD